MHYEYRKCSRSKHANEGCFLESTGWTKTTLDFFFFFIQSHTRLMLWPCVCVGEIVVVLERWGGGAHGLGGAGRVVLGLGRELCRGEAGAGWSLRLEEAAVWSASGGALHILVASSSENLPLLIKSGGLGKEQRKTFLGQQLFESLRLQHSRLTIVATLLAQYLLHFIINK